MTESKNVLLQARALWQARRLDEAERLIRSILATDPEHAEALVALAELLGASERPDEAIQVLNKLVAAHPNVAAYARRLGTAQLAMGDCEGALMSLERAVQLDPGNARGHNNLGEAYIGHAEPEKAMESYRRAINCEPAHAHAYSNLGRALLRAQRPTEAIEALEHAIALAPTLVAAHINLGGALYTLHSFTEALACYQRATLLDAELPVAWSGKADAEFALGSSVAALASTERALLLNPDHCPSLVTRARALRALARPDEARQCLERAAALNPNDANALGELGALLGSESEYAAASAIFERLAVMAPEFPYVQGYRLYSNLLCASWSDYELQIAALRDAVDRGRRGACTPFQSLLFFESTSTQRRCAETFVRSEHPQGTGRRWTPRARRLQGRIRLAYLSADFHEHATSQLMAGLFEAHDRQAFEVTGISFGPETHDSLRERVKRGFEHFLDLANASDNAIAGILRDRDIDIAVDLKGYTARARPGVLALRPAALQVNFLGYPGTMSADWIDYLIADQVTLPDALRANYAEAIVRLPNCYQVNDSRRAFPTEAPSRDELGLPRSAFVFACFNSSYKLTPGMWAIWMRLLVQVPGSLLWLLYEEPIAIRNLRNEAQRCCVDPARLVFSARTSPLDYLARQRHADLFLDTFPYNAHTTASDALWLGVPVLTLAGESFASRVAASILTTLGVPELIAGTPSEYERRAVELARSPEQLASLKCKIARGRLESPMFDTQAYCHELEAAYRAMWTRHAGGLKPAHLDLAKRT